MNMPKVTIATITYNSSKFVKHAIGNVLAHSHYNIGPLNINYLKNE